MKDRKVIEKLSVKSINEHYFVCSLRLGDRTESELFDSLSGFNVSVFAFSHLNAALTAFHFET